MGQRSGACRLARLLALRVGGACIRAACCLLLCRVPPTFTTDLPPPFVVAHVVWRSYVQVFEVQRGVDTRAIWREVDLLRRCTHDRVVPLLGVALSVGRGGVASGQPPRSTAAHEQHRLGVLSGALDSRSCLRSLLPPLCALEVSSVFAARCAPHGTAPPTS